MMLKAAVVGYLVGLLLFYTYASVFREPAQVYLYYGWDKSFGGGFLLWLAVYSLTKDKHLVMPVLILSIMRFVWEIISYFTGITVINTQAIAILFSFSIVCCLFLFLKDLSKWQKARP